MPLTLAKVRDHLKATPDEDVVLGLYMDAAIEAAERYTGHKLKPGEQIDVIDQPYGNAFRLQAKPIGGVVARIPAGVSEQRYSVEVRSGMAYLPFFIDGGIDRLELIYEVGPEPGQGDDVLVASTGLIELGILKFVAHAYAQRGDNPNDWATDSGAASLWSPHRPLAF